MSSDEMRIENATKYKKARPCHRLDSSTGGLLICSRSKQVEVIVKQLFRQKSVKKRYIAIAIGRIEPEEGDYIRYDYIPDSIDEILYICITVLQYSNRILTILIGEIATPISSKPALTKYKVENYSRSHQYGWITTVSLWPVTGMKYIHLHVCLFKYLCKYIPSMNVYM